MDIKYSLGNLESPIGGNILSWGVVIEANGNGEGNIFGKEKMKY